MLNLGIIVFLQIILESLPVSSSGHIALFEKILISFGGLKSQIGICCYKYLELALHLPSALIFLLFIRFFLPKSWQQARHEYIDFLVFIILTDLITAILYFLGMNKNFIPIWLGFLITGLTLIFSRYIKRQDRRALTLRNSLFLGCTQAVALQPGVSRLALTYFIGLVLGFSKERSFFLSLSLAIPLFIGGGLKGIYSIVIRKSCYNNVFTAHLLLLIILASILSFLLLIFLKWLIENDKYWAISLYLIIPILLSFFF